MQKSFVGFLLGAEKALIVVLFAVMTLASILQVLNRNIFHFTIGWTEEVARYCMVWVALLGTEVGLRIGGQMSIQAFTSRLKGKWRKAAAVTADLTVLVFCAIVIWYSADLMRVQIQNGQVSTALKIPMTIPYGAMLFTFTAMGIGQAHRMYRHLTGEDGSGTGSSGANSR